MFWKALHDLLKWLWPACLAVAGLMVSAAAIWMPAKDWVGHAFVLALNFASTLTGALAISAAIITWLGLYLWSSHKLKNPEESETSKQLEIVVQELKRIVQPPVAEPEISNSVTRIADWSNSKLKDEVASLSAQIREYETRHAAPKPFEPTDFAKRAGMSEEEKTAEWKADVNKILADARQRQGDFIRLFHPKLVAYRDELRNRLGDRPPFQRDHRSLAIDEGMLAGPSPLNDAVLILEGLARRLPDYR